MHRSHTDASPALDGGPGSGHTVNPEACPEEGGDFVTRDYELGFILTPEVNEEQTRAMLERLEQIVNNHGGQVMRVNQWGRRRLAYPIQHHRDGFYVFIDMVLTPETVSELDRTLKVSEEVLRHLIKRRDPRIVQKEREEREARANAAQPAPEAESVEVVEEQAAVPQDAANEIPATTSAEEDTYAPPAIEEETIEA